VNSRLRIARLLKASFFFPSESYGVEPFDMHWRLGRAMFAAGRVHWSVCATLHPTGSYDNGNVRMGFNFGRAMVVSAFVLWLIRFSVACVALAQTRFLRRHSMGRDE